MVIEVGQSDICVDGCGRRRSRSPPYSWPHREDERNFLLHGRYGGLEHARARRIASTRPRTEGGGAGRRKRPLRAATAGWQSRGEMAIEADVVVSVINRETHLSERGVGHLQGRAPADNRASAEGKQGLCDEHGPDEHPDDPMSMS
jgi:hypothetical protein